MSSMQGRIVNRLGKPGAIEPTSIDKVTPEQRFGADMPSAKPVTFDDCCDLTMSNIMRMMGYTRHPANCLHHRKRMYLGSKVWECIECGERS